LARKRKKEGYSIASKGLESDEMEEEECIYTDAGSFSTEPGVGYPLGSVDVELASFSLPGGEPGRVGAPGAKGKSIVELASLDSAGLEAEVGADHE